MTKKTRYLLLLLGFIIFLILAPVMVFYVTGLKFNLQTRQFVKTGILAVRSNPSSVNVLVNNKVVSKNDGDIKFLVPGEYNLSLEKTGYQPWSKRFSIRQNQVTWANPAPNDLTLFKNNTPPTPIASNVDDVILDGSNIFYISSNSLIKGNINDPMRIQTFPLNGAANKITTSPNHQYLLLGNNLFDADSQKLINLANIITNPAGFKFSDDNNLYALQSNTLYKVDVSGQTKTPIVNNVSAFTVVLGNIYYLQKSATGSALVTVTVGGKQPQILLNNLPGFNTAKIFVTFQKQVMLILDDTLYQAANVPIMVADNISDAGFDQATSNLLVLHSGELDYYNYSSQNLNFITRTSLPLKNFILRSDLGYAFFFKNTSLEALELDLRDVQNEYSFYQATQPQKFILDDSGKKLYILDDGKLMEQTIR